MLDETQAANYICLPETFIETDFQNIEAIKKQKLGYNTFFNLLSYCKLSSNMDSQSKPIRLVKIICNYYSVDDDLILLPNLSDQELNIDSRSARKVLVQMFFNILVHHTPDWVSKNISLLLDIALCNEDSIKEVFSASKIYPNQNDVLCCIANLKKDIEIIAEIKELYIKVTKDNIRQHLIHKDFNEFVLSDEFVDNKYLTSRIEEVFFNTDINNINDHPFKVSILEIISKIRDRKYAELFPRLDDKKANLMLEIVTNETTKDDIFSIVTLNESQLNKLGKLVQNANFEAILNNAETLIEQEKEKKSDFKHKYEIGTHIEGLIRIKLNEELNNRVSFDNKQSVDASDIQGGQDIIILLDSKPFYYIEVKSRWNSENSVAMSKLQLQRAVEVNDIYALCSVDVTKYTGSNDRYNLTIDEVIPITKFITNIGNYIKPLIEYNLQAEKNIDQSIHLVDYRGIIPQDIIKEGVSYSTFIENLISKLKEVGS